MKRLLRHTAIGVALIFLCSVMLPAAVSAQESATPALASESECGPSEIPPDVSEDPISLEQTLSRTTLLDGDGAEVGYDVAATIICIPAGTDAFTLVQRYPVAVTVLAGSLTVSLTQVCTSSSSTPCPPTDSEHLLAMYFSQAEQNSWQPLTATPVTLDAGDVFVLANVNFELSTGDATLARVIASGVPEDVGGGGCPCAKFP